MKIIFPVCEAQVELVSMNFHRFAQLTDAKSHDIFVTAAWADHFSVPALVDALKPIFRSVDSVILPDVPESEGWPVAPNWMFYESVKTLAATGNKTAFLWYEPDMFLLNRGGLTILEEAYMRSGTKSVVGAITNTRRRNAAGELAVVGKHVAGACIYPWNLLEISNALHVLDYEPFDVAMENELLPIAHDIAETLYAHRWQTGNYSMTPEGFLVGKALKPIGVGVHDKPVPKSCVILHGVKDLSIAKLLNNRDY